MADEKVIIEIQYDTDEAQKAVTDLTDDLFKLNEQNKALRKEQKKFKSNTAENIEVRKKLNRQIEANKDAIKRARRERNESIRVIKNEKSNFQKLGKTLKNAASSYLGVAAAVGVVIKGISSIIKSNAQFEQSLASLSAITGLVGDDLGFFADKAKDFSKETTQSANEVLQAFELVGSARPELLKNSQALAEVTRQSIILSEATGGKLGLVDAANAVTDVMNQMSLSADQASRIINTLAAGSKIGSAQIPFLAEAYEKAGTSANLMGLSVEEVTAALEANAPQFAKASVLGNSFDKVLLKLRENQIGYTSGTFNLNDAIDELREKYKSGTSAADIFGVEHSKLGELLVRNQGSFNEFTEAVTGTTTALEQQAIQNDTLGKNWKKLMNGIKNLFISTNISGFFNNIVKDVQKSFNKMTKSIETAKLVWQRLKGELTKTEYRQALVDLNSGVNEVTESIENNIVATEGSAEADKKKIDTVKELAKIEKKKDEERKERIAREKFDRELALEEEKAFNDEIATLNKDLAEEEKAIIVDLEQFELESIRKLDEADKAATESKIERRRKLAGAAIDIAGVAASTLFSTQKNNLEKETQARLAQEGLTEEQALKIQKEAAEERKKIAIKETIINGLLGIAKTFATLGFPAGIIPAAVLAASTLAQLAVINSQTFAKGGEVTFGSGGSIRSGVFSGPSHMGGGIGLTTDGGQRIEAEGNEGLYIVNKKDNPAAIAALSAINSMHGNAFSTPVTYAAAGGEAAINTNVELNRQIQEAIQSLTIVTRVTDINNVQAEKNRTVNNAIVNA